MTRSWSQFRGNHCATLSPSRQSKCGLREAPLAATVLPSRPLLVPQNPASVGTTILKTLSPSRISHHPAPDPSMGCMPGDTSSQTSTKGKEPGPIPCRNLSDAFEELYVAPANCKTTTPGVKTSSGNCKESAPNLISPTGVAELDNHAKSTDTSKSHRSNEMTPIPLVVTQAVSIDIGTSSFVVPYFQLHDDLKLELSQAVVNRVSIFGVIHDINKEATAMAANDDSSFSRLEETGEEFSPLVVAVNGTPMKSTATVEKSVVEKAVIDDERWLLSAIEARGDDETRPNQACPPTFLQAMGEREYENPLASLSNGSRTQLWKPSRSWWEAKSGKNPWIEPKSHNKRWRYLWPLIHYHKFLAKCIKKLKRNGVDVKLSVSPVASFLREEICAVSDHLAAVSLFDSERWMKCLQHFTGWTDTRGESESHLRSLVAKLKLRPLNEPGDVDSPLLRSQIDEQFLRAMVTARNQMEVGVESAERRKVAKVTCQSLTSQGRESGIQSVGNGSSLPAPQKVSPYQQTSNIGNGQQRTAGGVRRSRLGYPYQWWGQGYVAPPQYAYGDDNVSVHSSLSGDAYSDFAAYSTATPIGGFYPHIYPTHAYSDQSHATGGYEPTATENSLYPVLDPYNPEQAAHAGLGWVGHPHIDPSAAYNLQQNLDSQCYYVTPVAPASSLEGQSPYHVPAAERMVGCNHSMHTEPFAGGTTPYKYDPNAMPMSPFWAHLDRATLAMGLATPQTNPPKTPHRQEGDNEKNDDDILHENSDLQESDTAGFVGNAQPLLLRQSQYYGYGSYAPPSPATQFMMSPQASFAYNYGYGVSPSRTNSHIKPHGKGAASPDSHGKLGRNVSEGRTNPSVVSRQLASKVDQNDDRDSPSTVETTTESESLAGTR